MSQPSSTLPPDFATQFLQLLQQLASSQAPTTVASTEQPSAQDTVLQQCQLHKVYIGKELISAFVDHEELLSQATPDQLRRLFTLVAENKLTGLPVLTHQQPFVQQLSDLVSLHYNPLQRFGVPASRVQLLQPFHDQGFQAVVNQTGSQGGRTKEYRYLFSASSYLFEACAHLLSISASTLTDPTVARGLLSVLALLFGVFELLERRRQSLPLLSSQTAELVDIALDGTSSFGPAPTIPELQTLSKQLTDLKLRQARDKSKASLGTSSRPASSSNRTRSFRSRGRGRGRDDKGKAPA